ncbi:MAG: GNAT family N-acetyltransferase [Alphaproteobacteria bacterium]|nr:GNAT family N-acetyltransferase [Alphaproteobacteria bacterium]
MDFTWLAIGDLDRIVEIDHTERVEATYVQTGGAIALRPIEPFVGGWWPDVETTIAFCRDHMRAGAEALGAFDGGALIGIAMLTPGIEPGVAQLSFLQVSAAWRRHGIATRLLRILLDRARALGHARVYVTATPTPSAVGFYLRAGFVPVKDPIPRLYALEPDDIHMLAPL